MKTITCNRYSYNFYKAEGQPIVEWCIEGELKQVVRVTAEAGNEFFVRLSKLDRRSCMRKVIDKMADHAFVQMFIACERLNSRRGQCKIEQDVPTVDTISNVCPEMEPDLCRVMMVSASELEAEGFTIEDVSGKYLFWFDDPYGSERMFTFEGTLIEAEERAIKLCNEGCDCLSVEDQKTGEIVFDEHDYYNSFEVDEHAYCSNPLPF